MPKIAKNKRVTHIKRKSRRPSSSVMFIDASEIKRPMKLNFKWRLKWDESKAEKLFRKILGKGYENIEFEEGVKDLIKKGLEDFLSVYFKDIQELHQSGLTTIESTENSNLMRNPENQINITNQDIDEVVKVDIIEN